MSLKQLRRVCVYCGSNSGKGSDYLDAAQALGLELAARGIELIYGGSRRGTMGALADAVLSAGGRVVGVMPQALMDLEIAHHGVTEMHTVGSMHERKALMTSFSDAFVILPGGWGTLDEMCEALTWAQLNIHNKPCVLWNVSGYFDLFLKFLRHAVSEGFLKRVDYERLQVSDTLEEIFFAFAAFVPSASAVPAKLLD